MLKVNVTHRRWNGNAGYLESADQFRVGLVRLKQVGFPRSDQQDDYLAVFLIGMWGPVIRGEQT